jgi:hypothetical protein
MHLLLQSPSSHEMPTLMPETLTSAMPGTTNADTIAGVRQASVYVGGRQVAVQSDTIDIQISESTVKTAQIALMTVV